MRLGVLLDRFDPARGGAEAHTGALLRRAAERGLAPLLATLEGSPPPGVTRVAVGRARGTRVRRDRAFALDGVKALRGAGADRVLAVRHALSCDVYLPHGGLVADAFAARDAARGGVTGLTTLLRRLSGKRRFFEDAERALLDDPKGPVVIALSNALARRIVRRHPAAKGRVKVIPNGVDVERFDPAPFAAGRIETRRALGVPTDAYVGVLVAHEPWLKGYGTLLKALARPELAALSPAFHLVVAGRRAGRDLRRAAASRGVAARVHLVGPVADVRPLLAAADVLCQASYYDPCSLTSLEALAMGVPVITTTRNGVTELMAMRGGIPIEDPDDAEGFAKAIEILAEPLLRRQTSEDARFVARKNRSTTRLDQVIDACAAAGLAPTPPPGSGRTSPAFVDDLPAADPCLETGA